MEINPAIGWVVQLLHMAFLWLTLLGLLLKLHYNMSSVLSTCGTTKIGPTILLICSNKDRAVAIGLRAVARVTVEYVHNILPKPVSV